LSRPRVRSAQERRDHGHERARRRTGRRLAHRRRPGRGELAWQIGRSTL